MSEELDVLDAEKETPETPEDDSPTNAAIKASPLFQKLAAKVAAADQAQADRETKAAQAKQEAEEKRLADAGKFEELQKLNEQKFKDVEAKYTKDLKERDLKLALSEAGFKNKSFVKGAVVDFDGETPIDDYVKALADDPDNAALLKTAIAKPTPPGKLPTSMAGASLEQLKQLQKSDDPSIRIKANEALGRYYDEHGTTR